MINDSTARLCPALLISAPASNQGKTTITAGIARYHAMLGRKVRVFKTGPDFLDPMILERASGNPVEHLDLWMVGESRCKQLLFEAAEDADLILIEGVMGLFDGSPSSADLAQMFDIPIAIIINASSMAQTFHAIASGLANYRPGLKTFGVLANNVASERHAQMISDSKASPVDYLGCIKRSDELKLPDRHLGLVQPSEIVDLESRINASAEAVSLTGLKDLPAPVKFTAVEVPHVAPLLRGIRIAVARDAAFSFIYPSNVDVLEKMQASIEYFSPLSGDALPECDAVYLPGGYPELHLQILGSDSDFRKSMREHFLANKPIYAECGGMLTVMDRLTNATGESAPMLGLMTGTATLRKKLKGLGYQEIELAAGTIRGHTFHYSQTTLAMEPSLYATRKSDGAPGEPVYQKSRLWASYMHLYFYSNLDVAANFFK